MTHSPAPWSFRQSHFNRGYILDRDGDTVAHVYAKMLKGVLKTDDSDGVDASGVEIDPEAIPRYKADRSLLKAAPDLLAACEEAIQHLPHGNGDGHEAYKMLEAAIAKAKGASE